MVREHWLGALTGPPGPWHTAPPTLLGDQLSATDTERREHGVHYTPPEVVARALDPLLLDALRAELSAARSPAALEALHSRLARIRLFDPACGAGHFLVEGYRALRALEADLLQRLETAGRPSVPRVSLGQLHGLERDPLAVAAARAALDIARAQTDLGSPAPSLPLAEPHLHVANALAVDWRTVVSAPDAETFLVGNPPFAGKKEQTAEQKTDMQRVWAGARGAGVLDYVTAWLRLATVYLRGSAATAAFVTTSSVAQGEQVGVLWRGLRADGPAFLRFAHAPFAWTADATVHVVVLGLSAQPAAPPVLITDGAPRPVPHLSPYLVDAPEVLVLPRTRPLQPETRPVHYGSFALDDGQLTLSAAERDALLADHPEAAPYVRRFVGGTALLTGRERACLWLETDGWQDIAPIRERVEAVRRWRESRGRTRTVQLASSPHRFAEQRQPTTRWLALPTVSSERRLAVPVAFFGPEVIASNQVYVVEGAGLWELGVLSSRLHLAWVRRVAGRLGAGLRYSARIVYNNFPWPDGPREAVEAAARDVLVAREGHDLPLGRLYDPAHMPDTLRTAHARLDAAVEQAYASRALVSDAERVAMLLERLAALAS